MYNWGGEKITHFSIMKREPGRMVYSTGLCGVNGDAKLISYVDDTEAGQFLIAHGVII